MAGATTTRSAIACEPDVADVELALRIEQVGEDAFAGKRADRERRDELLRRLGHDAAHREAALPQAANEVERFIGRDPAADDEENLLIASWSS